MEGGYQVCPVVQGDLGVLLQGGVYMAIVGGVVLSPDGEDGYAVGGHQGGGHAVMGRERVAGAEDQLSAAVPEGQNQVGRLRGHVQAGGDAQPLQRPLAGEPLPDQADDRHLPRRPLDALDPFLGQTQVLHVMLNGWLDHYRSSLQCST